MYQTEDILEGARSIRPYLAELLGSKAPEVDAQLAALLAKAGAGKRMDALILNLLASHDSTREWMSVFLEQRRPPDVEKFFKAPPGKGQPIKVEIFTCPENDYTWYRRTVGLPVPTCPTHSLELVPFK